MELSFLHKIILLALDDKGWFGASENRIKFGLVGAILFELYKHDRITIVNEEIIVKNAHTTENVLLDRVLNVIKTSGKQKSLRTWIQRIETKKLMLRKTILKELIQQKIISREEYSLLVVFYQTKYPVLDLNLKRKIQDDLCEAVISARSLSDYDNMLLAVMNSCKMVRKNFGTNQQYPKLRQKISEITEFKNPKTEAELVIKALNTAITRAILASNVAVHL